MDNLSIMDVLKITSAEKNEVNT